jgi:curli biogenesis system outer membrane secretion channel CsgG
MKSRFFVSVALLMIPLVGTLAQSQTPPQTEERIVELERQISELKAIIASLQEILAGLQMKQQRNISIGIMPIENSWRIREVGNSFRQIVVSSFNEFGIKAYESLDEETLRWVQRQDQLVRERWIDPVTAPPRGQLRGISHYLLATVTDYKENQSELVIGGVIRVVGGGTRVITGSLVVDWRLVDATTGEVVVAFRTKAELRREEVAGGIIVGSSGFGSFSRRGPLPETAARICAKEAAQRIATLFGIQPPEKALPQKPQKEIKK